MHYRNIILTGECIDIVDTYALILQSQLFTSSSIYSIKKKPYTFRILSSNKKEMRKISEIGAIEAYCSNPEQKNNWEYNIFSVTPKTRSAVFKEPTTTLEHKIHHTEFPQSEMIIKEMKNLSEILKSNLYQKNNID